MKITADAYVKQCIGSEFTSRCLLTLLVLSGASAASPGGTLPPGARVAIFLPRASVTQTQSNTGWSLAKTGTLDTAASTVSWQINASPNGSAARTLTLTGAAALINVSNTPAPIGNVVVTLYARQPNGTWTAVASDVASATLGDAATSAKIVDLSNPEADEDDDSNPGMGVRIVTERPGSGTLTFTQGPTTPWSITPKKALAPWSLLDLRYTATFNNSQLNLADGTAVRAELAITTGSAGNLPRTVASVDIDGNGLISADESRVRTKARSLGQKIIPAAKIISGGAVAITDTAADVTTTGTVSFSNPVFTISGLNGTAKVTYAAGASGGTIANCAHLTGGATGTACNTQNIRGSDVDPCLSPGHAGCGWHDGQVTTYTQDIWGNAATAAGSTLSLNYSTLYASTGGVFVVGIDGTGGFSIRFSDVATLLTYLPDGLAADVLDSDYNNPLATSSGSFGSELVALKLNVDFAEAGYLGGTSGLSIGDLTLCGVGNGLDGHSVNDFLMQANALLGGVPSTLTVGVAAPLADSINNAFGFGLPSAFAQAHLVNGACN